MSKKRAYITGITGQDGAWLSRFLLEKGYMVYGLIRRTSRATTQSIKEIINDIELLEGDLTDSASLYKHIKIIHPDEIYNLGAQTQVRISFEEAEHTTQVTGLGALRILEAVKNIDRNIKCYQASSSEMFGEVKSMPQNEETRFNPASPYGMAKLLAHGNARIYKKAYGMYISCGILFNHESKYRGLNFVTRKITNGVARIKYGLQDKLELGNIDSKRDFGDARDYVRAMWLMLQQKEPHNYIIATGKTHLVREFCDICFKKVGLNYKDYVKINPKLYRPAEVNVLCGDASRAKRELGWEPKISFEKMIDDMLECDLKLASEEK